ncbi:MAG: Ig-like domain-containing protein, partial [Prevotellaceae bacterium]|nr:Ig-like domain-containing protein [Prevotellaceae bacterium]
FNAAVTAPDNYFRVINLQFTGTGRADGKYFLTAPNATALLTIGGIEVRGCRFGAIKNRAFFRVRSPFVMASMVWDGNIIENCLDGNTDTYGIIHLESNAAGSNFGTLRIANNLVYNVSNRQMLSFNTRSVTADVVVENNSFIKLGATNTTANIVDGTNFGSGSKFTFSNNIINGYCSQATGAPTQALNLNGSVQVFFYNNYLNGVAKLTNMAEGNYTITELTKGNAEIDFVIDTVGYTMHGVDSAYMASAGKPAGYCVGSPLHYPGYTPPVVLSTNWTGADGAAWNVASNWDNGLPNANGGTAYINSGVAQATGGIFPAPLSIGSATLKLAAAANDTISMGIAMNGGASIEATATTTLVVPAGIAALGASATFTVGDGATLSLNANIDGGLTLSKKGNGTLAITQQSLSFTGTWNIEGGSLQVSNELAMGSESKLYFLGGKLKLDGVTFTSLSGYFFTAGDVALPVGTYTSSNSSYVEGSGSLVITDSKLFRFTSTGEASWNAIKTNWFPIHSLVAGDTGVVQGKFVSSDNSRKQYTFTTSGVNAPDITFYLLDSARLRLLQTFSPSATPAPWIANLHVNDGFFFSSTSALANASIFGLGGQLVLDGKATIQSTTAGKTATETLDDRVGRVGIYSVISGAGEMCLEASDVSLATSGYGVDIYSAANTGYTGSWNVKHVSLVAKAAGCLGINNTITLSEGGMLYLDVDAATHKSQTVVVNEGCKVYVVAGTTHRLQQLVVGSTTFNAPTVGKLEVDAATAGINGLITFGAGAKIVLGGVPVQSVTISTTLGRKGVVVGAADSLQFYATIAPADADDQDITWSIDAGISYASIDPQTGVLTGLSESGAANSVTVKASTLDGQSATFVVKTYTTPQLISSLTVSGASTSSLGESVKYSASYAPEFATNVEIDWSVSGVPYKLDTAAMTTRATQGEFHVVTMQGAEGNTYTVTATAKAAPTVSHSASTQVIRATSYEWVGASLGKTGIAGWSTPDCWNPQSVPNVGDTAYVYKHAIDNRFQLGADAGNQADTSIHAKLYLMPEAQARFTTLWDQTNEHDPFTSLEGKIDDPAYGGQYGDLYNHVDLYLNRCEVGTYTTSGKTFGIRGSITVLDSSSLLMGSKEEMAAWYLEAELKGAGSLSLIGGDEAIVNNPTETGYYQPTIMVRRDNPDYTGSWYLRTVNLYSKHAGAFGRGNSITVGRGRKLIVDNAEAVDGASTLVLAARSATEPCGQVTTKQQSTVTIRVARLVLGGVAMPEGSYRNNTPTYGEYFGNYITVEVGTVVKVLATSVNISGPACVAFSEFTLYGVVVEPANASQDVVWSATPAGLATIDNTGGLMPGTTAGDITITAATTDGSGVSGTHAVKIGGCTGTGISSAQAATFSVAPNPVRDELRVEDESSMSEIKIVTLQGAVLKVLVVNGRSARVDVSGLAKGAYVVIVGYADGRQGAKVVVKQ